MARNVEMVGGNYHKRAETDKKEKNERKEGLPLVV